ncbi:MAG: VWA domain-containing protein [archaeon]|nr:VWA domain-containing protein [archaeon]
MSSEDVIFPFSAISGNELAKNALLCAAVNPRINGVLINGKAGTGKTTLIRSVRNLVPGRSLVNMPFNTSDERMFGSIDLEKAILTGEIVLEDGLVAKADGNFLQLDNVDLMDHNLLLSLLNAIDSEGYLVERDGISRKFTLHTTLFATTCRIKGRMDSHLMDRFDINVNMRRPARDLDVLRLELAYADCDDEVFEPYLEKDRETARTIVRAREILPSVTMTQKQENALAEICEEYGVHGNRGIVSCAEVAMTLSALDGRTEVSDDDLLEAITLTLDHRRTRFPKKVEKAEVKPDAKSYVVGLKRFTHDDRPLNRKKPDPTTYDYSNAVQPEVGESLLPDADEEDEGPDSLVAKAEERFKAVDLLLATDSNGDLSDNDDRKRFFESPHGKYTGARIPKGESFDIALDATIRAAAPYQTVRGPKEGLSLVIKKDDIREKIKTEHVETTFMFLLDTSGSLIIRNRMARVKATIISMLENHYVKRDRVGLMTFNEDSIDLMMEPTRATEELSRIIDRIAVGHGTPISKALETLVEYVRPYLRKRPNETIHVVLITDGKATSSIDPNKDPVEEAVELAGTIRLKNTDWIVIDTGMGYTKTQAPQRLAEALNGRFFLLDDLKVKSDTENLW